MHPTFKFLNGRFASAFLLLVLLAVSVRAFAGSAALAWDPVNSTSLSGYMLHYGPSAGNYTAKTDVGRVTSFTLPNLVDGATYHFAVTAYDASRIESGFSNNVSKTIPNAAPVAKFSASTTSGNAPLAMNFINSSTGTITSYAWNFGDGSTSTAQSPSKVYSAPGVYSVSLTVKGPGGSNTQTSSNYITVLNPAGSTAPVASFSANATSGTAPMSVNFSSASTGNITSYAWTFGDGTTSTLQNPSHAYANAGVYTVSLKVTGPGGSNTQPKTNYITVLAPNTGSTCPCTVWPSSAVPKVAADPDTTPVELGMKFTADRSGSITGIRFYKSSANTGTHVGSLWTTSGQLLARATFSNETASGWQQVNFATPVSIQANTVYVASYHTNAGRYSGDNNYFANAGVDRAPLHALRNGVSGNNGVYAYGPNPVFPSSSYLATNYWVDVVFK
jgi:PKD repeat protein